MKTRIAINGFGRIGRVFLRAAIDHPDLEIVAINDLTIPENLAYLLKYDSAYGNADFDVAIKKSADKPVMVVGKKVIRMLSQKDPSTLPWKYLAVDIVIEATGVFESFEKSRAHLVAGARRVIITAPVKDEPVGGLEGGTVLMGVNEKDLKTCDISSNASCTTNAASPVIAILHETIGIKKAVLNTVHGYTASQALVDSPSPSDFRRGRAAAQNIVPSTTGAAIAVTKAFPELAGLFNGVAMRVPVISGSIVDITFVSKRKTSVEEINHILKKAAQDERWKKVFAVTEDPVVSSDIIGSRHASIADLEFTTVVGDDLVKVLAWYDNEMGYVYSLLEHTLQSGKYIQR